MDAQQHEIDALASVTELEYIFRQTMNEYEAFKNGTFTPRAHELPALKHVAEKVHYLQLFMQNIVTGHR